MAGFYLWGNLRVEFGEPAGPPLSIGSLNAGNMQQVRAIYGLTNTRWAIGILRTAPFPPICEACGGEEIVFTFGGDEEVPCPACTEAGRAALRGSNDGSEG